MPSSVSSSSDERQEAPSSALPGQTVKYMLGSHLEDNPNIFCEMQEIHRDGAEDVGVWKEAARWIKFEEDVEEGGDRWSKPHVATLSLHSLFELRVLLMGGAICLDMPETNLQGVVDRVVSEMVNKSKQIPMSSLDKVKSQLLAQHIHQKAGGHKDGKEDDKKQKENKFLKHIPKNSEVANVLVGTMDCLEHPAMAFVRLKESTILPGVCEVDLPTKFICIILGGPDFTNYYQIGRSLSTLMSDDIFHSVAYRARTRENLLAGVDEFLDKTTVLPPGEWDPRIRIEPPEVLPNKTAVDRLDAHPDDIPEDEPEEEHGDDPALQRTGVLFGGLMNDIKRVFGFLRKAPFWISDFKDCLSLQCVSSFFFLYFAIITPVITFGGLWADATDNSIAAMESLLGAAMSGVVYHLFSGQPLTIIGATGPILVFDTIVYEMCFANGIAFIPFRMWIGFWTGVICLILVATDASFLVKYITRYTEESFSTLISLIFIIDGLGKIFGVAKKNAFWSQYDKDTVTQTSCECLAPDWDRSNVYNNSQTLKGNYDSMLKLLGDTTYTDQKNWTNYAADHKKWKDGFRNNGYPYLYQQGSNYMCFANGHEEANISTTADYSTMTLSECRENCGQLEGSACEYTRDVYLFSFLLSFGTFILATKLKGFKASTYFPTGVRTIISDFGVTAAIVIMVMIDMYFNIDTPKLSVPDEFTPSITRDWLVFMTPFGNDKIGTMPMWYAFAAIIPAIPATILVFLDQQITAVIVNRRENKLKKGPGYHLDLFIVAIMIIICSSLGLPWFVAATVLSITHVNSLKEESETSAPGEKPQFLGVREQRVTGILIFLSIGLSVLAKSLLNKVPMPVLYGVFLYMGVSSLNGVQLFDRLLLFFMPTKHQPDWIYLRQVPLKRVHLFTAIQVIGLGLLWIIKKSSTFSIAFPLMVAAIIFIRMSFDWFNIFTQRELSWLDDVMTTEHKEKEETKEKNRKKKKFRSPHDPRGHQHRPEDEIDVQKTVQGTTIWRGLPSDMHMKDEKAPLNV